MSRVRPSDRDRDKAIRVLREGCADGRLSTSTLELRLERALATRSVDELRGLTVDIERISRLRAWLSQPATARRHIPEPEDPCLWLDGIGNRPFVIGRSPTADLVIRDRRVSRRHAHIARTTEGFMLADLGSTNGTWIGERRISQVEVAAGDRIALGAASLRLV
jgi:hypothetical protein